MSVPILYCMGCPDLAQTGADGSVAVIADLLATGDPAKRVEQFLRALGETS